MLKYSIIRFHPTRLVSTGLTSLTTNQQESVWSLLHSLRSLLSDGFLMRIGCYWWSSRWLDINHHLGGDYVGNISVHWLWDWSSFSKWFNGKVWRLLHIIIRRGLKRPKVGFLIKSIYFQIRVKIRIFSVFKEFVWLVKILYLLSYKWRILNQLLNSWRGQKMVYNMTIWQYFIIFYV